MKPANSILSKTHTANQKLPIPFFLMILFIALTFQTNAQTSNSDEQTIRDLVKQRQESNGNFKTTENAVFVSGLYPRPIIGKRNAEEEKIAEKATAERLNQKRVDRINRLEVSKAGDIAYEFGEFTMEYDTPDKKHTSFDGAYVRAWKKVNGEWLVDVAFHRPNRPQ
jgi:ketosteroid isomerase-like protein